MAEPDDDVSTSTERGYDFNDDPAWIAHIQKYDRMVRKQAIKYCTRDEALQEDARQEAWIALATIRPETIHGFDAYTRGEIPQEQWDGQVDRFCGTVIRNSILGYLASFTKGDWYTGRTRASRDPVTGEPVRTTLPPRYASLDQLVDDYDMQVDTQGVISWPDPADDGRSGAMSDTTCHRMYGSRHWWSPSPDTDEEDVGEDADG